MTSLSPKQNDHFSVIHFNVVCFFIDYIVEKMYLKNICTVCNEIEDLMKLRI